jgi:hypothetical protein
MSRNVTQTNTNYGGIGFAGALTILFVALKLTGVIDWSWWWVLSPIWISASIVAAILIIGVTVILVRK